MFDIRGSLGLANLETLADGLAWERVLWPVDVAGMHLDVAIANQERAADFEHGRSWIEAPAAETKHRVEPAPLPSQVDATASLPLQLDVTTPLLSQWERLGEGAPNQPNDGGHVSANIPSPASSAAYSDELTRVYDGYGAFLGLAQATAGGWQPRLAIPLTQAVARDGGQP
jgi:hypothetical protein